MELLLKACNLQAFYENELNLGSEQESSSGMCKNLAKVTFGYSLIRGNEKEMKNG